MKVLFIFSINFFVTSLNAISEAFDAVEHIKQVWYDNSYLLFSPRDNINDSLSQLTDVYILIIAQLMSYIFLTSGLGFFISI